MRHLLERLESVTESKLPVYVGVFLDDSSRTRLLRDFPPKHPNVYADHVTLVFRPKEGELEEFDMGEEVEIEVVGYAEDESGSAVTVKLPPKLKRLSQRNPHVTISTANGVKPFYSNKLIAKTDAVQKVRARSYTGVVDGFPRG